MKELRRLYTQEMEAEDLALMILSWIDRTNEAIKQDGEKPTVSRNSVLIDDIEELCKKYLKRG
jgi:hypothetical protein